MHIYVYVFPFQLAGLWAVPTTGSCALYIARKLMRIRPVLATPGRRPGWFPARAGPQPGTPLPLSSRRPLQPAAAAFLLLLRQDKVIYANYKQYVRHAINMQYGSDVIGSIYVHLPKHHICIKYSEPSPNPYPRPSACHVLTFAAPSTAAAFHVRACALTLQRAEVLDPPLK